LAGPPRPGRLFDSQTPQPFFKGSKVSALEELALTETKLLEQTASILGISLAQLVKAGTLVYAKREFLNHNKYSAAEGGDSESALLRSGSGVAGVADARILAAYQAMAGANPPTPITPAKLASRAVTGYPTALRWLKIHHPELLVSKPDEASVAPPVPHSASFNLPREKLPYPAILFDGQLKTREDPGTSSKPYLIPVLGDPKKLVQALDTLRTLKASLPPRPFTPPPGLTVGNASRPYWLTLQATH
jgi:hypothetical protein